jgi:hypothetical protein
MKRAWKRVAERADNDAFSQDEIHAVLVPALEQDCRDAVNPTFVRELATVLDKRASYLFPVDVNPAIDGLRSAATSSLDRAILDNVCALSADDVAGVDLLTKAFEAAVVDRAARSARQMEEHYLRRTSSVRANHFRDRIENAITTIDAGDIAAKVLKPPPRASRTVSKRRGLDDGVELQ